MKNVALLVVLVFSLALASYASPTLTLNETFKSGATFSGTLTFLPNYSNLTAVTGVLSGGSYGTDLINWIWDPHSNFASAFGPQYGGNFLMDGAPPKDYFNLISITWDFGSAPSIVLATPGPILSAYGGNNVNYVDPMVSGAFGPTTPTPEPGTFLMFGSGVIGLASLIRRKLSL